MKLESILVSAYNGRENTEESCSYGYKIVCVDDKFSKPFKTYFGEDAVSNFINSLIEESNYCSDTMKKHFNKELVMTKEDNEDSTKYWIYHNYYVDNDVEIRDHCRITGKNRGSAHRDCNTNLKLNHKIPVVYHDLKNYDSRLLMQELGKFLK